jgi:FAD/FMN-containing dehydrogenase
LQIWSETVYKAGYKESPLKDSFSWINILFPDSLYITMAVSLDQKRIALETFLQDHTNIKYVTPAAPEFSSLKATYNLTITATPLAIVRPQSSNDVAALVSYCTTHGIQFSVRSGGNNLYGASCVQDALMVDMRDIAFVDIDKEKSSARVGGGILQGKLAKELSKEGLVTAMGSLGFVGFIGWGCYGGYGSLSAKYGLGVDNILAAKVVSWNGEIVDADEGMMKGIRGAGGAFGVIVELTVKVYPLKSVSYSRSLESGSSLLIRSLPV